MFPSKVPAVAFTLVVGLGLAPCIVNAAACEGLTSLELDHTSITLAENVAPGGFDTPPEPLPDGTIPSYTDLPAFCRVVGSIKPTADSDIGFEVWLPESWNGNFVGVGNGGYLGRIVYSAMAEALTSGYAVAGSDTGHRSALDDASFALGHPEKVVDFSYRATHEMTVVGKAVVAAFYDSQATNSFFAGCSAGGRQALTEAQKYPDDYDAIAAGAPAHHWGTTAIGGFWASTAMLKTPAAALPPQALRVLHNGALAQCDATDGVKDGIITEPRSCHFDPKSLACPAGATGECLSAEQVAAAEAIYRGPTNARTGARIMPGLPPGSESGWSTLVRDGAPMSLITTTLKYIVFQDPSWDYRSFDWDRDIERVRTSRPYDANNPDIGAFIARGGKLLIYHGWTDTLISAHNSIEYVANVEATLGAAKTRDAVRLFLAPGMNHCRGGVGPWVIDAIGALQSWSDTGRAPDMLIAKSGPGAALRLRPLCAHPMIARYSGNGSTDDAASFVCAAD